jgi:hypothetical protein
MYFILGDVFEGDWPQPLQICVEIAVPPHHLFVQRLEPARDLHAAQDEWAEVHLLQAVVRELLQQGLLRAPDVLVPPRHGAGPPRAPFL